MPSLVQCCEGTRSQLTRFKEWIFKPFTRWQIITVACIYVCYGTLILCRTSKDVASPTMLEDTETLGKGFNVEVVAAISGWANGAYFIGKILSGFFVDRVGGRFAFLFTLTLIASFTVLYGLFAGFLGMIFPVLTTAQNGFFLYATLTVWWSANKFMMAAGWPAATQLVCAWFTKSSWGTVFGILSTSSRFANVVSTFVIGYMMKIGMNWRGVFLVAGGVTILGVVFNFIFLNATPAKAGFKPQTAPNWDENNEMETKSIIENEETTVSPSSSDNPVIHTFESEQTEPPHPMDNLTTLQALKYIFISPRFWTLTIGQMALTAIFELNTFFPLYLKIVKDLREPGVAAMASTFWLLGAAISVFFAGFLYDRLQRFKFGRTVYMAGTLSISTGCALVIWLLPGLKLELLFLVIFIFGLSASPSFYIPMSVFSTKFGGKAHCGKLNSIIDSFAYGCAMVFDNVGGKIANTVGWSWFFMLIVAACVIGLVFQTIYHLMEAIAQPTPASPRSSSTITP